MGEGAHLGARHVQDLAGAELGWTLVALAVVGAALSLAARRSRPWGATLLALVLTSAALVTSGAPAGPWRFGALSLVLVAVGAVLAGVSLARGVVAVAEARVPLASVSAALVLLLAATLPVLALDDAIARSEARAVGGTRAWDDDAFEALPAGAVLLVSDRRVYTRALAARATGELRADLSVVAAYDAGPVDATAELAGVLDLKPLLRDYVLYGAPRERTLSLVAAAVPLALDTLPAWDRALSRHVLPAGLFATFLPEPRGGPERARALDDGAPATASLRDAIVPAGDAELAGLSTRILDARAAALSSLGEREAAARVADDALGLALPGTRGARRPRRLVTSRFARAATSR